MPSGGYSIICRLTSYTGTEEQDRGALVSSDYRAARPGAPCHVPAHQYITSTSRGDLTLTRSDRKRRKSRLRLRLQPGRSSRSLLCLSGIFRRETTRVRGHGADVRSTPFGGTDRLRHGRRLGRGRRVRHGSAPPLDEGEIEAADGDDALPIGRGCRPLAHPATAKRGRGVSKEGAAVGCGGCLALDAPDEGGNQHAITNKDRRAGEVRVSRP